MIMKTKTIFIMAILLFTWMGRAAAQTYDGYEIYEGKFDEVNGILYLPDDDWKEAEGSVLSTYTGSTISFKNNVTFKLRKFEGYDEDNNPIYDYKTKTLPLTKITGTYYKNPNVKGVYIPDNVKEIGPGSFDKFTGLITVTGCSGVEKIEASAFQSCTALKNASFIKVKEIGYRAFKGCTALETIGLGAVNEQEIGEEAFDGCTALSGSIPVNGTVGRCAFRNCEKITKVDISTTADSIGPAAFIGCSELETIEFNGNTKLRIGNRAFYGIKKVRTLLVGGVSIGEDAFSKDENDLDQPEGLESVTFSPSVKIIGSSAFRWWGSLKHLDLGTSVEFIGNNAFTECGMEAVQFSPEVKIIDSYAFYECPNLKKVEIPKKTKIIGNSAFYKCPKLTEVTMTGVDSIADAAFYKCEELTSIALGDSLRFLGNYAFEGCTKIEGHIKFPKPLEYIGWKNFSGCRKITGIDLSDELKGIGWEAFRECSGITKLTLPGKLEAVADGAFYNCWNIESKLVFPATMKNIGFRAFHNCEKLQGIDLKHASELESIGFQAFYGCDGLTGELWIPDAVTTVGKEAFWFCSGINSLYIGASLTEVGENAFISFPSGNLTSIIVNKNNPKYDSREDCNAMIETATNTLYKGCCRSFIPQSVTAIGDDAFQGCDIIGEINIPDGVTSIGDDAFAHCYRLREIPQLYSIVTIGDQAFEACYSMPGIIFGSQLKEIGRAAFNACVNLQHATFKSSTPPTVGEWAFIYDPEYSPYMFIPCNSTAAYQAAMPEHEKFIESDTYTVSVVSNDVEMGKVSYKSHDLCESNTVTVTAIPEPGFRFLNWTGGISQNPCTFSVQGDLFLVAYFEAEPEQEYTIRALSNDSTQGTVTSGGLYLENATATLTAVPKECYQFLKWQDENTDNPRSIVVTSDATFTAFFDVADGIDGNFADGVQIYSVNNTIVIGNAENSSVSIYNSTGQLLINEAAIATNKFVISVEHQGIYFVKVGKNKVQRVLIK
jgi:hypothetical protein